MLDVFLGIGFTSVMILLVLFRAVRADKAEPWFLPLKPKEVAVKANATPWKRRS
jgi:hypothetical protein